MLISEIVFIFLACYLLSARVNARVRAADRSYVCMRHVRGDRLWLHAMQSQCKQMRNNRIVNVDRTQSRFTWIACDRREGSRRVRSTRAGAMTGSRRPEGPDVGRRSLRIFRFFNAHRNFAAVRIEWPGYQ